jgi:hypothetical protein
LQTVTTHKKKLKKRAKFEIPYRCGYHDCGEFWEKERAWLFYESGVQDMREIKILENVYKV